MLCACLIFFSNSFCLATIKMIRSHSVTSGPAYVKIKWTSPKYGPERYQLKYVCTTKPTYTPSNDTMNYVTTKTQTLSSATTSFTISDLHRSSTCVLILLAEYNPASIDTGIVITGATVDEDTSKTNSGLLFLLKKLVRFFILYSNYLQGHGNHR